MKIVILRFNKTQSNNKQLTTSYYASCALCNALQDPTFVNNGNLHIVGEKYGGFNTPNIGFLDDDDGIDCIFEAAVKCGFIKQPADPSKDVYELLHGTYQEPGSLKTRFLPPRKLHLYYR